MENESKSVQAINLARRVFEAIHGNLGLLKFNVDELVPTNGSPSEESKKWRITCSFYETLGSTSPSQYIVNVDLNNNTVDFKKISGSPTDKPETGVYKVIDTKKEEKK
jgi:hypothetical protein